MSMIQSLVAFLGRALLSIIFIASACGKIFDWNGTVLYFNQGLTDWLALSVGNNFLQQTLEWSLAHSSTLLLAGVVFELLGGLMVFLGIWTRVGALLLILFLVPTTLVFHHFWQLSGADHQMQMIQFMKNVSICGGLLYLLAMGKGVRCRDAAPPSCS